MDAAAQLSSGNVAPPGRGTRTHIPQACLPSPLGSPLGGASSLATLESSLPACYLMSATGLDRV